MNTEAIVVVGGGAFGTALASVMAARGTPVLLHVRDQAQCDSINRQRINIRYLPDSRLPDAIRATTDDAEAFSSARHVFLALPSHSLTAVAERIVPYLQAGTCVLNLAKGLHAEHLTLDRALSQVLVRQEVGALKGPNFARPLLNGAPSGMTLAVRSDHHRHALQSLFADTAVHLEHWGDVSAVEFISAVKNVLAVVMGMCDAIEDNPNTRFMILKKVISEANELLLHCGFDRQVLFTYAGLGDLLMTALNDASRNRTLGLLIGRGFDFIHQVSGPVTEGKKAARLLCERTSTCADRFPLVTAVDAIFAGTLSPQQFHRDVTRGSQRGP